MNETKHGHARTDATCPQCGLPITFGQEIKWIPRKLKAHHAACQFNYGRTFKPSTSDAPSGDSTPTNGITNKDAVIRIAREVVTDATANILSFAETTAKREAASQAATYFETVTAKAKEIIEAIAPRKIELIMPDATTRKIDGLLHHQFETLLRLVQAGTNVWMYGAAGGGKSTVAEQVATALGLQFQHISLNVQSQPSLIMGYRAADGHYVRTPFRDVYENGGIFLIDEIDASNGNFLTSMNTALANGSCAFPDGNIARHKNAIFLAASNTAGNGASGAYNTRNKIDAATRERFVFLKWEYDTQLERQVTLSINENASAWFDWTQAARSLVESLSLNVLVSPRASIEGAKLLRVGLPYDLVVDAVVFKGIDADTRTKVLANAPLPN